jgi:L-2,4-diaminobutyric acid acetyltransferase
VLLRAPTVADGPAIWQLVADSRVLDRNSAYLYLLIGAHFFGTSVVAEAAGSLVGAVTGYRLPAAPEVLFVWQVVVAEAARGRGLAGAMVRSLLQRPECAGVSSIETTVSPANRASRALFDSLANRLGTSLRETAGFPSHMFPGGTHEDERLLRIGPFTAATGA